MFTATVGSSRSGLRSTSSPFGSVYFSTAMRGALAAVAVAAGRVWADEVVRPATARAAASINRVETRVCIASLFRIRVVETGPQIPAGHRSVGAPRFSETHEPLRRGRLAQPVCPLDGAHDTEVTDRQHIRPVQAEHQEHLGGPAADALDRGQGGDDLIIG